MPNYLRPFIPGGTFFLTLVTESRAPLFPDPTARANLHDAVATPGRAHPFMLVAVVLIPGHLHLLLTLLDHDHDFSLRVAAINSAFTRSHLASGGPEQPRSESRLNHRRRGVWQRRFWDHAIRDRDDLHNHLDYTHYNPVKHGLAACPHAWPHSSFHRAVTDRLYAPDWFCTCNGLAPEPPDFSMLDTSATE